MVNTDDRLWEVIMSYIDLIKEKARQDIKTIVLPETNDRRTLIAAAQILKEGLANIIMVGNEEKIMDGARWLEVDLSGVKVVDPAKTDRLEEYVTLLYETRKSKGMTMEKAREILLKDYLTFGVLMVKANDADGMVAGACHATGYDIDEWSTSNICTPPFDDTRYYKECNDRKKHIGYSETNTI